MAAHPVIAWKVTTRLKSDFSARFGRNGFKTIASAFDKIVNCCLHFYCGNLLFEISLLFLQIKVVKINVQTYFFMFFLSLWKNHQPLLKLPDRHFLFHFNPWVWRGTTNTPKRFLSDQFLRTLFSNLEDGWKSKLGSGFHQQPE